jgi:tellurite resistance protein TerC
MQNPAPLDVPFWAWLLFAGVILLSLIIDLVAHRGGRGLSRRHAVAYSIGWIVVALLFGGFVALKFGTVTAQAYLTAYLIEKSLSVDNLFVFLVIFARLKIPEAEQHRVLFWGIIGALVTRAAFIAAGAAMLTRWHFVVYVLGAFLIYTGVKTVRTAQGGDKGDRVLPFLQRHLRLTPKLHGHHFVVVEAGRRVATPLMLAVIAIEVTDVVFAIDSVPAVFAISQDPFIVYSSNVFAILGLRALYLVLADMLKDLKYLHYGLAAILVFAGAKMLTSDLFHLPHAVSLLTVAAILLFAIIPSVIARRRAQRASDHGASDHDVGSLSKG